jgi:hypothetical protein
MKVEKRYCNTCIHYETCWLVSYLRDKKSQAGKFLFIDQISIIASICKQYKVAEQE